jgi:hypothetical protein
MTGPPLRFRRIVQGIPPAEAGQFPQPIKDKADAGADELAAKDTKPKGFAS